MEQNFNDQNIGQIRANLDQRQAVESLLEMENGPQENDRLYDWNIQQKQVKKSKKYLEPFNFIQTGKKSNPELNETTNFLNRDTIHNVNKFRRAKSLFDPMKIFKVRAKDAFNQQNHQKLNKISNQNQREIIHKHSNEIRDLNFKNSHPTKSLLFKRDPNTLDNNSNANEFINGQSVIIQVQSYEENFNKKEMEYLMNKTLGSRNFRSHLSLQKKQDPLAASVLQLKTFNSKLFNGDKEQLKNIQKTESRLSPKLRFTAYVNKKSSKDKSYNSTDQNSSQDLGSIQRNQEIAKSLKLLINNLKNKKVIDTKDPTKISYILNSNNSECPVNRIFDKEGIFKQYEEEQFRALKRVRMGNKNLNNQDIKKIQVTKSIRNQLPRPYRKYSKQIQNQGNDMIRVSSPRKYYQKAIKKEIDQRELNIFQIKKLA